MTKKEACHLLADINEKISEIEDLLLDIEKELSWGDKDKRDWYLDRQSQLSADLAKYKQEHDDLISNYGELIYS